MPKKINPVYQKKIEDIKVERESFASSAMKGVYIEQKQALDEVHKLVGKIYIDYAKEGFLNISSAQKAIILANVKKHLKETGMSLSKSEVAAVTNILKNVFELTYYKSAYTLDEGMKTSLKFNILKPEFIDRAVNTEFKGEMFSDRIWANKASMMDQLQAYLVESMKGNISIDKIGRQIRDTFNVSAYDSHRLVYTETARIQTQATDDIARSAGVKQQMYSATLDIKTNPEDASFDGNIYDVDDESKPEIPQHPNCRCCYINIPNAEWKPEQRIDNESGKLIDYQTYEQWAKDKGI